MTNCSRPVEGILTELKYPFLLCSVIWMYSPLRFARRLMVNSFFSTVSVVMVSTASCATHLGLGWFGGVWTYQILTNVKICCERVHFSGPPFVFLITAKIVGGGQFLIDARGEG